MKITVGPAEADFVIASGLIAELDADLLARYPGEPVNGIEPAQFRAAAGYFVLAKAGEQLAGCGAFKPYNDSTIELKRMFVRSMFRGHGIGRAIVQTLEAEAKRRGYVESILETAHRMPEAIALYRACGYEAIPRYGQYVDSERSVCLWRML